MNLNNKTIVAFICYIFFALYCHGQIEIELSPDSIIFNIYNRTEIPAAFYVFKKSPVDVFGDTILVTTFKAETILQHEKKTISLPLEKESKYWSTVLSLNEDHHVIPCGHNLLPINLKCPTNCKIVRLEKANFQIYDINDIVNYIILDYPLCYL